MIYNRKIGGKHFHQIRVLHSILALCCDHEQHTMNENSLIDDPKYYILDIV